jgi:hypothetical protein
MRSKLFVLGFLLYTIMPGRGANMTLPENQPQRFGTQQRNRYLRRVKLAASSNGVCARRWDLAVSASKAIATAA